MASIGKRLIDVVRSELRGLWQRGEPFSGEPAPEPGVRGAAPSAQGDASRRDPRLARYYANLELPYGADLVAVKAAWRRLARTYHPDLHSQDPQKRQVAEELVKGLNFAYEELSSALPKESARNDEPVNE